MIVPRDRLLWVAALGGIPLVTLLAMGAALSLVGALGLALLAIVAASDALVSRRELEGITVLLAGRISLFKARPAELEIRILNERQNARVLRFGLNLPPTLVTDREDVLIELPAGAAQ